MKRLEDDYAVVGRKRPVLSKEGTQNVRYEIADNFLRFWFRYIDRNRDFMESDNLDGLAELIKADYPTYSGMVLERYFRQVINYLQTCACPIDKLASRIVRPEEAAAAMAGWAAAPGKVFRILVKFGSLCAQ